MTARGAAAILAALVLVFAACGRDGADDTEGASNRLLVLGDDGNIFTVLPDGSDRVDITDDAGEGRGYLQPTWSPMGERIAWSELRLEPGRSRSFLRTGRSDGTDVTGAEIAATAFYLYWNPDGERLVHLSRGIGGLDLGLIDVAAGGDASVVLDQGQPYYFSWSPDGKRLLVHVGDRRLELLALDGGRTTVDDAPGLFQAPQWSRDGTRIIYAAQGNSDQALVLADPEGGSARRLVTFDGFIAFALNSEGDRVAYRVTTGRPDVPETAVLAGGPRRAIPDALVVLDLTSGEELVLASDPVLAFYWSPHGRSLLFLVVDLESGLLRWHVWEGEQVMAFEAFQPSVVFAQEYLPFFDQFAQSQSFWSPGSDAFVYAGTGMDERSGIWVQRVEPGIGPALVVAGQFASWSPG
ncbi:MAG: TolB family protein [Acidimicrobiia bacterium]